jgi:hypothetical protein
MMATSAMRARFVEGVQRLSALARGLTAAGIILYNRAPFTVNLGTDRANIGAGPARAQFHAPQCGRRANGQQWFNTNCAARTITFGNAGETRFCPAVECRCRNSAGRSLSSERARLEFRFEVFNLFNRVNFDAPTAPFTPNFGRIFSAGPSRQMQLR